MSALPGLGGNNSYASNSNRSGHIAIVDGGAIGTVVTISSASAQVTLSKIKIYNGFSHTAAGMPGGGGINNMGVLTINHSSISNNGTVPWGPGGGIYNSGALTINTSTISGNKAHVGGGISNNGILRISNSTISQNVAKAFCIRLIHYSCEFAYGGGISTSGTVTITNSTISANWVSGGDGGGISSGTGATINNSTISQNGATCLSIQNHCYAGSGGDISSAGSTTVQNSIVANSPSGGNCSGTMTSNGYNISSDSTCNFSGPGDLNNTDPMLGPLQNNGGSTQTMALPSGSPAIDAGNPSGCTDGSGHLLKTDQRGKPRPDTEDTGGCDIGAYERQTD